MNTLNGPHQVLLPTREIKYKDISLKVGPLLKGIAVYEEKLADFTNNKNLIRNGEEIRTATLKAKKEFDVV